MQHHSVAYSTSVPFNHNVVDGSWQFQTDFPYLTREDIRACLSFAADRERRLVSLPPSLLAPQVRLPGGPNLVQT